MIQIDFTSGFQAIQNKGVHYRFAFADLLTEYSSKIQLAAANIIREYTETDPGGYSATFIRDGLNGDIYAVLMDSKSIDIPENLQFPEGKEHFLRQFPDWVLIESDDAEKFKLNFTDMIGGWLPQHWFFITKCLEHPTRPKSKSAKIRKWSHGNHFLSYYPEKNMFVLDVMHGAYEMSTVCKFHPNEIFTQPE